MGTWNSAQIRGAPEPLVARRVMLMTSPPNHFGTLKYKRVLTGPAEIGNFSSDADVGTSKGAVKETDFCPTLSWTVCVA